MEKEEIKEISMQQVVENETFTTELKVVLSKIRRDRSTGGPYKRSPYDDLLKRGALDDREKEIKSHFLEILEKKSKLSSAKRLWVKSVCDLALRIWIKKYAKPSI